MGHRVDTERMGCEERRRDRYGWGQTEIEEAVGGGRQQAGRQTGRQAGRQAGRPRQGRKRSRALLPWIVPLSLCLSLVLFSFSHRGGGRLHAGNLRPRKRLGGGRDGRVASPGGKIVGQGRKGSGERGRRRRARVGVPELG